MSLITVAIANGILAAAIVAALAYVCRIPYQRDIFARPNQPLLGSDARKQTEPVSEQYAA